MSFLSCPTPPPLPSYRCFYGKSISISPCNCRHVYTIFNFTVDIIIISTHRNSQHAKYSSHLRINIRLNAERTLPTLEHSLNSVGTTQFLSNTKPISFDNPENPKKDHIEPFSSRHELIPSQFYTVWVTHHYSTN